MASPERAWERVLEGLPKWLADFLWNVSVILRWLVLPAAFLSTVVDLRPVVTLGLWLYANAGDLGWLVQVVADAAHAIVDAWRSFTEPLFGWINVQLPFEISRRAFDFVSALLIMVPGLVQFRWALAALNRYIAVSQQRRLEQHQSRHELEKEKHERLKAVFYEFEEAMNQLYRAPLPEDPLERERDYFDRESRALKEKREAAVKSIEADLQAKIDAADARIEQDLRLGNAEERKIANRRIHALWLMLASFSLSIAATSLLLIDTFLWRSD